jgi:ferritin-like metal-binding protein YciE
MESRESGGGGRVQVTCDTAAKWPGSDFLLPLLQETSMAKLTSLEDLLVHELQDIYNAEGQILKALPRMIKAASHPELKSAFEEHRVQTEGQVERLEQVFKLLGIPAKGKKCEGMAGLLEEGKKTMAEDAEANVMDAALIAAAQKVEHYEIAAYGCVCTYAEMLGHEDVHELLGQTLEEEEETDQKLTALAESVINVDAETEEQPEEKSSR